MHIDFAKLINRNANICDRELYREFSVLVPIIKTEKDQFLLFEIRSENLNKQPNEICLPGGKIESMENALQAAVRETTEELLIPEKSINVIAELDTVVTPFNSILYPYVGEISEYSGTFNPDEVKETFVVPMTFLMEKEPLCHFLDLQMKPGNDFPYEMIQKGSNYPWRRGKYPVYFYIYKDKIIWGITARIIKNFIEILKK